EAPRWSQQRELRGDLLVKLPGIEFGALCSGLSRGRTCANVKVYAASIAIALFATTCSCAFTTREAPPSNSPSAETQFTGSASQPGITEAGGAQKQLDTSYPTHQGRTIKVARNAGARDLQSILDNANPGDVIELQAGATYEGNFSLPAKSGRGGTQ